MPCEGGLRQRDRPANFASPLSGLKLILVWNQQCIIVIKRNLREEYIPYIKKTVGGLQSPPEELRSASSPPPPKQHIKSGCNIFIGFPGNRFCHLSIRLPRPPRGLTGGVSLLLFGAPPSVCVPNYSKVRGGKLCLRNLPG